MSGYLPVCISSERTGTVVEAYEKVLDCWIAPYRLVDVPTSFGITRASRAGPRAAHRWS
jgi:hypothetical protein